MTEKLPPELARLYKRCQSFGTKANNPQELKIMLGLLKDIHAAALKCGQKEIADAAKQKLATYGIKV